MRHSAAFVACAVVSLAAITYAAQSPSAPPTKSGNAIILGRVVEAGTNSGVVGAVVTLYGPPVQGSPGTYLGVPPPGGPPRVATDSQGRFLFRDLPAGSYSLRATATAYVDGAYGETSVIQMRRSLDVSRTVDITDADKVVPVSIQLWRNGGIGGRVIDEAGEPMVGMPVSILARVTDWSGVVTQMVTTVLTDDRGVYHKDVTPGDYIVGVLAATTTVPAAAVQEFLQVQVEGGAAFEKYMNGISAQGSLLPRGIGARVGDLMVSQLATRNTQFMPPVMSDGSAASFFPSMYHPASLTMSGATVIAVGSGEERTGVDVHVRPVQARRVSGRISGPSGPVPGLAIRLVAQDPSVTRTSPATLIDTPQAMADANGDFVFVGVAPGAYHLVAIRSPMAPADALLWTADTVTVGDRDVSGVQVQMQGGAAISGRVVIEGTGTPPPIDNLRAMLITSRPVPGSATAFQARPLTVRPDQSLRFVSPQLIQGAYMMAVANLPPGWVLKSVTSSGENIVDRQFNVGAPGLNDVIVTITNQISTVTGIVRDTDGKISSAATVAVFPADKTLWRLPGMSSRRVQTAAPGRDGRYAFRGLPAGEYYVVAVDWPSADFSDGKILTAIMSFAQRFTLGDGESRIQDLRMAVMR
jgi:hypothetical protein